MKSNRDSEKSKASLKASFWQSSSKKETPTELNNFFEHFTDTHNTVTVLNIIDCYECYEHEEHPLARQIRTLLYAIVDFLSATSPQFKEIRDKMSSQDYKIKTLEVMASAIREYQQIDPTTENEKAIVQDALKYCTKCIKSRINELQKDDSYYKIYNDDNGGLKSLLNSIEQKLNNIEQNKIKLELELEL